MRTANCHPESKHHAKGLCYACYLRAYTFSRSSLGHPFMPAVCHPKRNVLGADVAGRCRQCWHRDYTYKLHPGEYDQILSSQGGTCAACTATENLVVDHDRSCCPVRPTCGLCTRAILCQGHNRTMAFLDLPNSERIALEHAKSFPWRRSN